MPKRARLKPLPYWTNARVVFNANKEVVAVEGSKDLLGLSEQQRQQPQQQPKGQVAGQSLPTAAVHVRMRVGSSDGCRGIKRHLKGIAAVKELLLL